MAKDILDTFDVFVGTDADNKHWGYEIEMYGFKGNDVLIFAGNLGNGAALTMYGGGGVDTLWGGETDDTIYGGRGDDTIITANGFKKGTDNLYGGKGKDAFVVYEGYEGTIKDYQPNKDTIITMPDLNALIF